MSFERVEMHIFVESMYLSVVAVLFGVFEIEAEGKFGWGEKFPTWYRVNGFVPKLYGKFTNKPLTGYHAALFFVPIMIFLWPMVATDTVSLHGALAALGFYFAWVIIWDFSWFILNPAYGVSRFRRNSVWWFAKEPWLFGRVPFGYISGWATSLALAAASGGVEGGWQNAVVDQAQQLGWYLAVMVVLAIVGAPLFRRYYFAMRKHDERDQAGIFHNS